MFFATAFNGWQNGNNQLNRSTLSKFIVLRLELPWQKLSCLSLSTWEIPESENKQDNKSLGSIYLSNSGANNSPELQEVCISALTFQLCCFTRAKSNHQPVHPFPLLETAGGSDVKASARNAGKLGSIPRLGRSPGEGNGNTLQCSCLENPMDGGAWWAAYSPRGWKELDTTEWLRSLITTGMTKFHFLDPPFQ